jgi:rare lipoprotein A (peptidoglycan hydrolase)
VGVPVHGELAAAVNARAAARRRVALLAVTAAAGVALGCASAEGARRRDRPIGSVEHGKASFYGRGFAGRKTASGERFNPEAMTAASPSLPFGTRVRVTRQNGASVEVRINDRCGCLGGRIIDLSEGVARRLGMIKEGVAWVRFEVIGR